MWKEGLIMQTGGIFETKTLFLVLTNVLQKKQSGIILLEPIMLQDFPKRKKLNFLKLLTLSDDSVLETYGIK